MDNAKDLGTGMHMEHAPHTGDLSLNAVSNQEELAYTLRVGRLRAGEPSLSAPVVRTRPGAPRVEDSISDQG
jgi:hypothetical protein